MADNFDLQEIGSIGLRQYNGVISEEIDPTLSRSDWLKAIRQMIDTDDVIGSAILVISTLIKQVNFFVQPNKDDPKGEERAALVDGMLFHDMSQSWSDTLSEIISFIWYGWSYFEIVYKRRLGQNDNPETRSKFNDGLIGWRKFAIRPQESLSRWSFDDKSSLRGMYQRLISGQEQFIPIEKSLLFRTESHKGNPEGRSLLRSVWPKVVQRKRIENSEAIGIDRDLAGLPIAWIPSEYLSETADASKRALAKRIQTIVSNIRRDKYEGLVMPLEYADQQGHKRFDITLLNSGGARSFDTTEIIEKKNSAILRALLVDIILLGHESVGTFSLSMTKQDMLSLTLAPFCNHIASVISDHAIPRLYALNGWDAGVACRMGHSEIVKIPVDTFLDIVKKLTDLGVVAFPTTDGKLEQEIAEHVNLPIPINTDENNNQTE